MRAGALTEYATILRGEVSRDETGSQLTAYTPIRRISVEAVHRGGARGERNQEIAYPETRVFRMRIQQPITEYDRLEYGGKTYRVLSIEDIRELGMKAVTAEKVEE